MRLADLGPLPLTLIASLVVTIVLLVVRVFVMQRVQQRRQRENRQETERLKSLVAAFRSLAGSFSPASGEHGSQRAQRRVARVRRQWPARRRVNTPMPGRHRRGIPT